MKRPFFYLAISLSFVIFLFKDLQILPADHISNIIKDEPIKVSLKGTVIDDPVLEGMRFGGEGERFLFKTSGIRRQGDWQPSSGTVAARLFGAGYRAAFGDELILDGELSMIPSLKNPHTFDYEGYMRSKNIYGMLRVKSGTPVQFISEHGDILHAAAYGIRRRIRGLIRKHFDRENSGLLEAIMIGDRSGLSQASKEEFVKTGTVHILAISGLHVGLVAGIFIFVYKIFSVPRKIRYLLAVPPVLLYALISGSNPPVMRAGIMFVIFAIASLLERDQDSLNSLGAAAVIILILNPKSLFDPSFQLSFAAILSIILLSPGIKRFVRSGTLSVSIAATMGTAPAIAYYFNVVSLVAVIANLVIIPLLFLLMAALIAFLFLSAIFSASAIYSACIVSWLEKALFAANAAFSTVPFSHIRVEAPSAVFAIFYYTALFLAITPFKRLLIPLLIAGNIFVWGDISASGDAPLKVTFLDVGHGDAAFIEFPNGAKMLLDGGSGGDETGLDIGRSVLAPFFWNKGIHRIDAVVATHPDEDHIGGLLYVLENFDIGLVIDNGVHRNDTAVYRKYLQIIREKLKDWKKN